MSEEKLQSDIARKFSELYPKKRGQLFHVPNERNHELQAYKAKTIGIVSGVADLLYFSKKRNVATELKVAGSRHKRKHIKLQIWWAKVWESQGGHWRLCKTVNEAISCYNGIYRGLTIDDVEKMLEETNTKTIKF